MDARGVGRLETSACARRPYQERVTSGPKTAGAGVEDAFVARRSWTESFYPFIFIFIFIFLFISSLLPSVSSTNIPRIVRTRPNASSG
ncbi:hypothetical protein VTN02DRAFT_914 [Thermoascus thermophilus]